MKGGLHSVLFVVCLLLSFNGKAQVWISTVSFDPDTPRTCRDTEIQIKGFLPATNYTIDSLSAAFSGDSLLLTINASFSGFGFPGAIPFDTSINVQAVSKGTYVLEINYSLDDSLVEQYNDVFPVKTCCNKNPKNLLYIDQADGFTLKWDPVDFSNVCQVRGRPLGTSAWNSAAPIFGVEPDKFFISDNRLLSGVTYQWQVRCGCSLSPLTGTNWSAKVTFFVP